MKDFNESSKPKILFLYAELMGYIVGGIKSLVLNHHCSVKVISWDNEKKTPYAPPAIENVTYHQRSHFDKDKFLSFFEDFRPDIIYVSGWSDKGYLTFLKSIKGKSIVVSGLDTQWRGTLKQRVGTMIAPYFQRKIFNYMWVAGRNQYEYATRMGFAKSRIIYDLLAADIGLYHGARCKRIENRKDQYPKKLYYVGRFHPRKGLDLLIEAFERVSRLLPHQWELVLVGNGPLKNSLLGKSNVVVKDFMQTDELIEEVLQMGAFILPSRFEAWGVVLHEFAALGVPLVASDECGAATEFLKHGYNGFLFENGNIEQLERVLMRLFRMNDDQLIQFGDRSHLLSHHINPETFASNLLSVLK